MIDRNLPFHQSLNGMKVRNSDHRRVLMPLLMEDWFHALLRLSPWLSVNFLLFLWVAMVGVFAAMYWYLDNVSYNIVDCGLGPTVGESIAFAGAFAFSLETCTTVGYGLPGTSTSFFEKTCSAIQVTVFFQMIWSMMFNAFLFAFFYSLISKSEFRSSQIIFTNKLLVNVSKSRRIEGNRAYVRLQCYDIDSAHPLVEAHARMYVLDNRLKMHPLRLIDPNDDLGGVLYPSVPADIVHHIDCHSPLSPRRLPFVERGHGLVLRSLDSHTGNRDEIICPVCGEAYGTYERLTKHIEYNAMLEAREGAGAFPQGKSHVGFELPEIEPLTIDLVRNHIEKSFSEIIVVVEAIDPQLSGTFQSLQSYKYEDIVFDAEFAKCMSTDSAKNEFRVDMEQFHKTCKHGADGCSRSTGSSRHSSFQTRAVENSNDDDDCEKDSIDSSIEDKNENRMSHISEAYSDDDDDDDEVSLENGGTYFRRDYDTFSSVRNLNPMGTLTNIVTGRRHQRRISNMSSEDPPFSRLSVDNTTIASSSSIAFGADDTEHEYERMSINDRKPSYMHSR